MSKGLLARIVPIFWIAALARAWFFSRQASQLNLSWTIRWTMPRWFSKDLGPQPVDRLAFEKVARPERIAFLYQLFNAEIGCGSKQRRSDRLDAGAALFGDLDDIQGALQEAMARELAGELRRHTLILELAPALLHLLEIARRHCLRQHGVHLAETVAIFANELLQALIQLFMAQEPHRGPAQQKLQPGIELVLQGTRDLRIERVDRRVEGRENRKNSRAAAKAAAISAGAALASPVT